MNWAAAALVHPFIIATDCWRSNIHAKNSIMPDVGKFGDGGTLISNRSWLMLRCVESSALVAQNSF